MTTDSVEKPNRSAVRKLNEERDERALTLRASGMTYRQIANALNVSVQPAHAMVTRALARSAAVVDVDKYRELELARMDLLLTQVWPHAIGRAPTQGSPGITPSWEAVAAVLRISQHVTRLLGLTREPSMDFEAEIRKAAISAGEDPDEAVKEAMALLRGFEGRKGRGGLMLVSG